MTELSRRPRSEPSTDAPLQPFRFLWIAGACLLVALWVWRVLGPAQPAGETSLSTPPIAKSTVRPASVGVVVPRPRIPGASVVALDTTATEVVAGKLNEFAKARRAVVHAMAQKLGVAVPADVDRYFDAVEGRRWEEADELFLSLKKRRDESQPRSRELDSLFPAVHETVGVSEVVREWPAEQLLEYGNRILGSLRPGMVYLGGTDAGRYIPTLLAETSEERPIVLTQNALADNSYLEYARFLHGDRLNALTPEDSNRAFQDYVEDARRRYEHGQQFPNEPPQIKPGEQVEVFGGKTQVGGQVAVMAINERLTQALMQRNPGASFAMEESYPFAASYAQATTLGPVLELGVSDASQLLTADRAAQSVEYWKTTANTMGGPDENSSSAEQRRAYAKMAAAQAGLLNQAGFSESAMETYAIAARIHPGDPEVAFRYSDLLVQQNRAQDAIPIVRAAVEAHPEQSGLAQLLNRLQAMQQPSSKTTP